MQNACAEYAQAFCSCTRLAFDDSFVGAFASASAAIDTGVGVDDVLAVTLRDSAQGASIGASTTADASISDHICHVIRTSIIVCDFTVTRFYKKCKWKNDYFVLYSEKVQV